MTFFISNKIIKNKFHIIAWGAYIIYEVFITGFISNFFGQAGSYIIVYFSAITLFYIHAYLLNIELSRKNQSILFFSIPILIFIEIAIYTLEILVLRNLFTNTNIIKTTSPIVLDKDFILSSIWRSLYFIGFSTGYVFILKSFEDRKKVEALERAGLVSQIEKQTLENDLMQSQNNFLRSQINPHFLFNTLNFIYNDTRKKAPIAAEAIMNLSEMMRYALKRPELSEMVPLNEEVEQIQNLINLHQLRTVNSINLKLEVNGDLFGVKFPPLILLTLVENIFKHGNVSHTSQAAIIKIDYTHHNLTISTINMINDAERSHSKSHHVGIENIQKRLKSFYPDQYVFKFYKDPLNRYLTEIIVPIHHPMTSMVAGQ